METSDINVSRPRGKIVDYDDDSESEDEIVVKSRNQEQGQGQVQTADVGTYVRDIVQEIVTNIDPEKVKNSQITIDVSESETPTPSSSTPVSCEISCSNSASETESVESIYNTGNLVIFKKDKRSKWVKGVIVEVKEDSDKVIVKDIEDGNSFRVGKKFIKKGSMPLEVMNSVDGFSPDPQPARFEFRVDNKESSNFSRKVSRGRAKPQTSSLHKTSDIPSVKVKKMYTDSLKSGFNNRDVDQMSFKKSRDKQLKLGKDMHFSNSKKDPKNCGDTKEGNCSEPADQLQETSVTAGEQINVIVEEPLDDSQIAEVHVITNTDKELFQTEVVDDVNQSSVEIAKKILSVDESNQFENAQEQNLTETDNQNSTPEPTFELKDTYENDGSVNVTQKLDEIEQSAIESSIEMKDFQEIGNDDSDLPRLEDDANVEFQDAIKIDEDPFDDYFSISESETNDSTFRGTKEMAHHVSLLHPPDLETIEEASEQELEVNNNFEVKINHEILPESEVVTYTLENFIPSASSGTENQPELTPDPSIPTPGVPDDKEADMENKREVKKPDLLNSKMLLDYRQKIIEWIQCTEIPESVFKSVLSLNLSELIQDELMVDLFNKIISSATVEQIEVKIDEIKINFLELARKDNGCKVILNLLAIGKKQQIIRIARNILCPENIVEMLKTNCGSVLAFRCSSHLSSEDLTEMFHNLGVLKSVQSVPDHCWNFIDQIICMFEHDEAVKLVISELLQDECIKYLMDHRYGHYILLTLIKAQENFYLTFLTRWITSRLLELSQRQSSCRLLSAVLEQLIDKQNDAKFEATSKFLMSSLINKMLETETDAEAFFESLYNDENVDASLNQQVPLVVTMSKHLIGHKFVMELFKEISHVPETPREKLLKIFTKYEAKLKGDEFGRIVVMRKYNHM